MFENEISDYALNVTKRYTGDRVKLSVLLSDVELPEEFKKFAEAQVEEYIDKEGLMTGRSGRFDLSAPEVQALFKQIRHILKNSYEFSREEFLDLADKASKFVFNFVIRPRWTLEKFLFKGEQQADRAAILKASRFFSCYAYYPRGMVEYLDFHGRAVIDVETWRKLHAKIDEHLISTLPAKLETLTSPLFRLFQFSSGTSTIPSDAIVLFFRDKSADEIVDRVEFAKDVRNIPSLDLTNLAYVLEAASKDLSQNIGVLPETGDTSGVFKGYDRKKFGHPPSADDTAANDVTARIVNETSGGSSKTEESDVAKTVSSEKGTVRQSQRENGSISLSVRQFMSAKLEEKVVKKIFRGSRSSYQIAMHRLDDSENWQSASKIVEALFIDNDVDPFSKYAVAFTDAVSARFRSGASPDAERHG